VHQFWCFYEILNKCSEISYHAGGLFAVMNFRRLNDCLLVRTLPHGGQRCPTKAQRYLKNKSIITKTVLLTNLKTINKSGSNACNRLKPSVSKLRPAAGSGPRSHFIRPAKPFCEQWKKYICTKNVLIWWNVTHPETMTLRNMSGPRTVVQ